MISGIAAIPLAGAKLWAVYPRLFEWPSARSVLHALERLGIAVLVAAVLLELFTGLLNTLQWYPWPFPFRQTHFWLGWLATGGLLVHLAVKAPLIARNWRRPSTPLPGQRAFLASVTAATGLVTLTTAKPERALAAAPRPAGAAPPRHRQPGPAGQPHRGPGRRPDRTRRLAVGGRRPTALPAHPRRTRQLPQYEAVLPIACVEGWSASARWGGVRITELLARAARLRSAVRVTSLEADGPYRVMEMPPQYADDPLTLLALRVNGATLNPDHGFPARIVAPNRPGVLQTKWVARIEVL
ncbi:molybdopterin-dependent oxidoreductase [Kitasatospora arboriphila]